MKLTEAKLKQMILEAYKKKYKTYNMDFGIPTRDEKLRSDFGDEIYDKIQSLDKNQADIMKQSLDPGYPMEVRRESLRSFMESYGFYLYRSETSDWMGPGNISNLEVYISDDKDHVLSLSFSVITNRLTNERFIRYRYDYRKESLHDARSEHGQDKIKIPEFFDYNIKDKEDREIMSFKIFLEIKDDLQKILEDAGRKRT